jgi:hypothetical protein
VNSVLQPTLGLRWLLCYEENDSDVCHVQKAAPKHWFKSGERIAVERCPTRFGTFSWQTDSLPSRQWRVQLTLPDSFNCTLKIYIRPADGKPITATSLGRLEDDHVSLTSDILSGQRSIEIKVS